MPLVYSYKVLLKEAEAELFGFNLDLFKHPEKEKEIKEKIEKKKNEIKWIRGELDKGNHLKPRIQ